MENQTSVSANQSKNLQDLDIINLIKEDHKPLKELIKVLKDSEKELDERQEAFAEFAPLLISHAKPEEQVLYMFMKNNGSDLREDGFEGDVEHQLADQMVEEIMRTEDEDLWSARVKVLAELVEHHIEEEEEDMLPEFESEVELAERAKLGDQFLEFKTRLLEAGGLDTVPSEKMMDQAH